ncbi:Y+L amino acid transporter 1 [Folsomia candida]|uniref:Y+L amino acid transporter 1 n=1 Tax=Folsomia candida TaxID=158441 RepID=A0A226EGU8_FOLCA|nr:Y+L amino acid transporter 1 [Folsomia candida]
MNDTSGLKRTASTTSRISQKSTKGVGTDDLDDPAGVITDQYGTRFRFKRRSTYEPLLTSSVDTDGGGGRIERRRSSAMQRSAGAGIAGPLIVAHLLSDEDEVSEGEEEEGSVMSMGSEHGGKKGGARRRKKIRLLGCIGVTIGCVLGSGIFAAPQVILDTTENAGMTLIVWFTYGMIALIGALCYVELACTIPVSGGDYAPTVVAIMSSVVAKNLINPYVDDPKCFTVLWATRCIAIMLICLVVYVNYASSELAEKIQGWLMVINVATITLIVICGIIHIAKFGIENKSSFKLAWPHPSHKESKGNEVKFAVLQLVRALFQASFSYFGYSYVTYIMEDVENPLKTVPLSIFISIPIVIVLNIFVNFCYLASIPLDKLKKTQTVASEMVKSVYKDPDTFPHYLLWIGPTLVAIAVLGGLLSNVLTCSRVSFIGARNRHFPGIFTMTHYEKLTPVVSLVFMGLIGCTYCLLDITMLIGILTYIMSAINCMVIYGLIYLRIKRPELPRPFKLPLFVPICYASLATFLFFTPILLLDEHTYKGTLPSIGGAIFVLAAGLPIYALLVRPQAPPWPTLQKIHGFVKRFFQRIWLVLPEEEIIADDEQDIVELVSRKSSSIPE